MSDQQLHLDEPTTVAIAAAGLGRIRVVFDAGRVDPQTPQEQAAAGWLAAQLAAKAARAAAEDDANEGEAEDSGEVPDRVDDVKAWVGDDPARAKAALEAERSRSAGPRSTLEPWLVEAAGLADGDDAPDDGD